MWSLNKVLDAKEREAHRVAKARWEEYRWIRGRSPDSPEGLVCRLKREAYDAGQEARYTTLARAYLLGYPYREIEPNCKHLPAPRAIREKVELWRWIWTRIQAPDVTIERWLKG